MELGVEGAERLLANTRQLLDELAAGRADPADTEELHGHGEAADGQIRVTAASGGRIESVSINPRLLRAGTETLGEQITIAVNAALDDLGTKVGEHAAAAAVADPALLAERLRDLHAESVRQMGMFTQGITDAVDRINRAAGK